MYNTVKAIHVALDNKINQINSNRKQTFYPEEYDMAINEAVREYVNSLLVPILNPSREGIETNKLHYDKLKVLKREIDLIPYYDKENQRVYTFLPADYKTILKSDSNVFYRRGVTVPTTDETCVVKVYNFDSLLTTQTSPITLTYQRTVDGRIDKHTIKISDFYSLFKTFEGRFVFIDKVIDIFRRAGIDGYFEYFDLIYRHQSLITSEYAQKLLTWDITGWTPEDVVQGVFKRIKHPIEKITKRVDNDLLASEDVRPNLTNYHDAKNRHLNPISEIVNNRLYVYVNDDFYVSKINLTYYKEPCLCNYRSNVLPDIPITDAIVDRAARIILGAIKDQFGYQVEAAKANLN